MRLNAITSRRSKVRGQGMTEYIIIVALIAVAAIGVYNLFGSTIRNQTASMAAALGGDADSADKANKLGTKNGKAATDEAKNQKGLENFSSAAAVKPQQ